MGNVVGHSASAVAGSCTMALILLRTNSARRSFACGLTRWSEYDPRNSMIPPTCHASS